MLPRTVSTGWILHGITSASNVTDLVGGSSASLPCGFSGTGGSGRFEYDGADVVKVNCDGLDVVHCIQTLQIWLADA